MDLKNLSSNWKKLQGTLKKESVSTTKRKPSDRETENGVVVKKRKRETVDGQQKPERKSVSAKRKRMSTSGTDGGENGAEQPTKKSTSRRNSTVTVAESKPKINEGRSPT